MQSKPESSDGVTAPAGLFLLLTVFEPVLAKQTGPLAARLHFFLQFLGLTGAHSKGKSAYNPENQGDND